MLCVEHRAESLLVKLSFFCVWFLLFSLDFLKFMMSFLEIIFSLYVFFFVSEVVNKKWKQLHKLMFKPREYVRPTHSITFLYKYNTDEIRRKNETHRKILRLCALRCFVRNFNFLFYFVPFLIVYFAMVANHLHWICSKPHAAVKSDRPVPNPNSIRCQSLVIFFFFL